MLWFVALASVILWSLLSIAVFRTYRSVPGLPDIAAVGGTFVSVICPARDEAASLAAAVRTRLQDPSPELEFILVDDRSRDQTREIMDALAEEDRRVRVIHVTDLPEGWLGKVHAQNVGAAAARGDWLLFSDADVCVKAGLVHAALRWAQHERVDHVALVPRIVRGPLLLRIALPSMMLVLMVALKLWKANDDQSDAAMGVGAFNLVRRDALQKAGGMKALRMEIADDVGVGMIIKESGGRSRLAVAADALQVEWYRTTRDFLEGMEKGAAKAGGRLGLAWRAILILSAGLILCSPVVLLPLAGLLSPSGLTLAIVAGVLGIMTTVLSAWRFALPCGWAACFPLSVFSAVVIAQRSLWLAFVRGQVRWRGDDHDLSSAQAGERVRI